MSTAHKTAFRQHRPYLHHVIREDDSFICAICASHYDTVQKAEICLQKCWKKSATEKNLSVVRTFSGAMFRCPLCMRLHREKDKGVACMEECRKTLRPRVVAIDLEDLPPPPAKKTYAKPMVVRVARKPYPKDRGDEESEKKPTPAATEAPVSAPVETQGTTPAQAAPAPKKPRDRTKKFTRDNAKYVCFDCKKVHFTKKEAEDCFDSHE